jgi:hypothetical protein
MVANEYLQVRVTPKLRQQLKQEAAFLGIRPNELVRMLIAERCSRRAEQHLEAGKEVMKK